MNLKQNNLEESTTNLGFVRTINENKGETIVALEKEVTLEDGTTVTVEGITPSKMKRVLNSMIDSNEDIISYVTPGEEFIGRDGVVQYYNDNQGSPAHPELTYLQIRQLPNKTVYADTDETIDYTGLIVEALYSDGTIDENFTGYSIDPPNNGPVPQSQSTIAVDVYVPNTSVRTSFNIYVGDLPVELTRLEVTQLPTKTEYELDELLDYTGLVVKAYYNNGTIDNNYTDYIANPAEGESVNSAISFGSDEAYISIYDSNYEHSTSFNLTVKTLSSLEVLQLPNKTVYNVGESLDLTGLQVKATYSDGTVDNNYTDYVTEPAEGYEFGEFDTSTVTIYKESLGQFSGPYVDFNITINTVELQSIEVTQVPDKTSYNGNESLDYTGLVVKATYTDGTINNNYTNYTMTPNEGTPAAQSYNEFATEGTGSINIISTEDVFKSTSFNISIDPSTVVNNLFIIQLPTKTTYNSDDLLDLTDMVVKAEFIDNSVDNDFKDYTTSPADGADVSTAISNTVEVAANGRINDDANTSFQITIED